MKNFGLHYPRLLLGLLPELQQQAIKARARQLRARLVRLLFSYTTAQLDAKLRALGVVTGDAILMQSAFHDLNGFDGEALDVIDCILNIIGPHGHLFMMSMPYNDTALDYLQNEKPFEVLRTPSQMGLVSELFRRRRGVLRSANPMHPVLAFGPRSEWIVSGHEDLSHSCGEGSPFEKMLTLDTKALLFDVDLDVLTFTHYVEHVFRDAAPTRVYADQPLEAKLVDARGQYRRVVIYPFAPTAMGMRNFGVLYDELLKRCLVSEGRIGNTQLHVVSLRDVLQSGADLVDRGGNIFAHPGEPTRIKPIRRRRLRRLFWPNAAS